MTSVEASVFGRTLTPSTELPTRLKWKLWDEAARGFERIAVQSSVMGGQPVIKDTRVPVYLIVSRIADGCSVREVIEDFEGSISAGDVQEALRFAASLAR